MTCWSSLSTDGRWLVGRPSWLVRPDGSGVGFIDLGLVMTAAERRHEDQQSHERVVVFMRRILPHKPATVTRSRSRPLDARSRHCGHDHGTLRLGCDHLMLLVVARRVRGQQGRGSAQGQGRTPARRASPHRPARDAAVLGVDADQEASTSSTTPARRPTTRRSPLYRQKQRDWADRAHGRPRRRSPRIAIAPRRAPPARDRARRRPASRRPRSITWSPRSPADDYLYAPVARPTTISRSFMAPRRTASRSPRWLPRSHDGVRPGGSRARCGWSAGAARSSGPTADGDRRPRTQRAASSTRSIARPSGSSSGSPIPIMRSPAS